MSPEEDPAAVRRRLVRFLARGGSVVREDVGGVIGVRCCGAARSGREFSAQALDRLIEAGFTSKRIRYAVAPEPQRLGIFRAYEQPDCDPRRRA